MLLRSGTAVWRWISTTTSPAAVKSEKEGTVLFRRLTALGLGNNEAKVAQVMDEWHREGRSFGKKQLISYAFNFRRLNQPHISIQLFQWMEDNKVKLKSADRAVYIYFLAQTKGIALAENYFYSLEESAKTKKTYGALLSCYCCGKMMEKATELFKKMKDLNLHADTLHYNSMMTLYMKVHMPGKVPLLVQEMEEKNIALDLYSYNHLMKSYAALKDIGAAEGVLERMKLKSKMVKYKWFTLGNLATIYVNAGLKDEANAVLKELEKMEFSKDPEPFHILINLYSRMSDSDGVNRAWKLCKSKFPKPGNASYRVMHVALSRLGDFDGLEKLFRE